jgi:hypothetical protein
MAGDNKGLLVVNEGRAMFEHAMRLAFDGYSLARNYFVSDKDGLVLLWSDDTAAKAQPLPYPMNVDSAIPLVWNWLEQADYGRQPDHDGDNGKGWTLHRDGWGHVGGSHYAIVGIRPTWAMYGK